MATEALCTRGRSLKPRSYLPAVNRCSTTVHLSILSRMDPGDLDETDRCTLKTQHTNADSPVALHVQVGFGGVFAGNCDDDSLEDSALVSSAEDDRPAPVVHTQARVG